MEVIGEDMGILIDGAVLENNLSKYGQDDYGTNVDVIENDVENCLMLELFSQLGLEGSLGC